MAAVPGRICYFILLYFFIYISIYIPSLWAEVGNSFSWRKEQRPRLGLGRSKTSLFPLSKTSSNLSLFFLLMLEWGGGHLQPHNPTLYPWPLWGWVGTGPLADDVVNGIVSCSDGKTQWDLGWGELSMGSLVWGSPYITFRSPYMAFRIPIAF